MNVTFKDSDNVYIWVMEATNNYEWLLEYIKENNHKINFGIVFPIKEGRKHRLWCGTEDKPMFRISIKHKK